MLVHSKQSGSGQRAKPTLGISRRTTRKLAAVLFSAAIVVSVAACSSGSPSSASSSGASAANVDAAKAAIAPFIGTPSAFPVTDPLPTVPFPSGKTFVFLQCSTPVCAQVAKAFTAAVTALGATPTIINAGATAQTAQAAASSVIALKPDAVIISG